MCTAPVLSLREESRLRVAHYPGDHAVVFVDSAAAPGDQRSHGGKVGNPADCAKKFSYWLSARAALRRKLFSKSGSAVRVVTEK